MHKLIFKILFCITCCFGLNRASAQSISISASADTICAGSYVHFSAVASGTGTPHYQWMKNSVNVGTDSTGFTTAALSNGDVIMCLLSSTVGGSPIAFSAPIVMAVYNVPSVAAISGASTVCRTATTTLSTTTTGGAWSSSAPGVANVNAAGVVMGNAGGTVTISYTLTNYCGTAHATHSMTVNTPPVVAGVTGPTVMCLGGAPVTFTDSTAGGTWVSSNTTVATVGSTGAVTPVALGSSTISYSVTNACGTTTRTKVTNVIAPPSLTPITGSMTLCEGDTVHLHNTAPGGTWSSLNSAVALATNAGGGGGGGAFGLVVGIGGGTVLIKYAVTNQCGSDSVTATVTVNPLPLVYPISGADSVCPGGTTAWTNAATGGTWSSGSTTVATVGTDGTVTGVAAGSAVISYSLSNDCGTTIKTKTVYVACPSNLAVDPLAGNSNIIIAPNPAHDIVYVQGIAPSAIKVINMMGQTVKENVRGNNIAVQELPAGVYFVRVYDNAGNIAATQQLVKQ